MLSTASFIRWDAVLVYSESEVEYVELVARALRSRSVRVWFDRWVLPAGGMAVDGAVGAAMSEARAVVFVVGAGRLSARAQRYLRFASARNLQHETFRLFGVTFPGAQWSDAVAQAPNATYLPVASPTPHDIDLLGDRLARYILDGAWMLDKPIRIFLCHAKEDASRVEGLYYALLDRGFEPWYDKEKLLVGDHWRDEIMEAIRETDFFALCLSGSSVAKVGFIQKEIRTAVTQYELRPRGRAYLLPLRLENCKVPELMLDANTTLADLHWLDVFDERDMTIDYLARHIREQWFRLTAPKIYHAASLSWRGRLQWAAA